MPPARWQPPAFLLPSWSETQLSLIQHAHTRPLSTSAATLHSRRIINHIQRQTNAEEGQPIFKPKHIRMLSLPERNPDGSLVEAKKFRALPKAKRPKRSEGIREPGNGAKRRFLGSDEDGNGPRASMTVGQKQVYSLLKTQEAFKLNRHKLSKKQQSQGVSTPLTLSPDKASDKLSKTMSLADELSQWFNADDKLPDWTTSAAKPPDVAPIIRPRPPDLTSLQAWKEAGGVLSDSPYHPTTTANPRSARNFRDHALLTFGTHDKTLDQDDFLRVAPIGKHVSKWRRYGRPVHIMPSRHSESFEPTGHYCLAFRNTEEAEAYLKKAREMHRGVISASDDTLKLLPSAYLGVDQEDIEDSKAEWTLACEGQPLNMHIREPPLRRTLARTIQQKGYAPLSSPEGPRARRAVLLWVDAHRPHQDMVQKLLIDDGIQRGIQWSASANVERYVKNQLSEPALPESKEDHYDTSEYEDVETGTEPHRATNDSLAQKPGHDFVRWVLTFKDENEARRFIRRWHMRDWPHKRDDLVLHETARPIHASLLW